MPGYRVGELLGAGGTGTVWAATREADGTPCAIKVVAVAAEGEASAAARELAVLGRVDVEGLVGFHEAVALRHSTGRECEDGVGASAEGVDAVALVLDHVGGGSLERVVRARGRLSVGESVTVLAPVARTLAALHQLGVVHGDVSPGNVLLERTGRPLLADLGVARLAGELPGDVHGTDGFAAPEVLDGGAAGSAADVYAVGALAWWCVTGSPPGPAALRPPLESLVPGLPPGWLETTRAALRGDPALRPTAADLALAYFDAAACEPLRLVVGSDETSMLTHRLRSAPAPSPVPPAPRARRRGGRRRRHRLGRPSARSVRVLATVGALVAVLATGGSLVAAGTVPAGRPVRGAPSTGAVDPLLDPRSPDDRTLQLVQALSDLRSRAMESASPLDLARLDAPGSPALAADSATLARLRSTGQTYEGVHLVVRGARATEVTARDATVEAVVDTAPYRVVADGVARRGAPVAGQRLRFSLVRPEGRWLVARVDPVTGAGARAGAGGAATAPKETGEAAP